MIAALPYIYRWDRHGRKGQQCRVLARSRAGIGCTPLLIFGHVKRARFNSILVEFADGFRMVSSGNAIRRVTQ